ncbi:MAG: TlpA family protein disulfide reductase [Reyranellaceae bacterium]
MAADPSQPTGALDRFEAAAKPGTIPTLPITAADGSAASLSAFAGKVVVLNFWATWCAPCIREMPSLDRLQAVIGDDDLAVVALSQDRNGWPVMRPFVERLDIQRLHVFHDPNGAIGRAAGTRALPTTVVYGRDGREVGRLIGTAEWDSPEALALIRKHLGS